MEYCWSVSIVGVGIVTGTVVICTATAEGIGKPVVAGKGGRGVIGRGVIGGGIIGYWGGIIEGRYGIWGIGMVS